MADIHRRRLDGEKSGRGMLGFRCRKSLDFSKVTEKSVLGTRKRESEAPEDVGARLEKRAVAELPEKYALLESLYEGVEAAISLLGIRRELCTFEAVCAAVEATTKRRFLQKHLAQIKYILPEAIDLEYVRSYDAGTLSNKWELKISLLPMPAEAEEPAEEGECAAKKPKIETVQRRRAFHARLVKFASTHSEEDDVPTHPMPERTFNGNWASKGTPEFSMPAATTCIPMEIKTTAHRAELQKSDRSPALSSHFSKSFNSCFSLKSGGSFIRNTKPAHQKPVEVSPASPGVRDTILPMPINRTSHRDVHNLVEMPTGTPHLVPSFKPFFSLKRSLPEPDLVAEDGDDPAPVSDIPTSSVQHTPLKRRHAACEEEREIVEPVELRTPIKIIRSVGTPRSTTANEFESPSKRPHFSSASKAHFSVSNSRMDQSQHASSSIPSTPVKPSISKEVPISWDVRTPGRTPDAVDQSSPIDQECSGLKTPVKSLIPANPFRSPAPVTHKHQHSPCTPQVSECGESSIYVSNNASQPGSACHDGFKSPAATPLKQGSAMRSLFGTKSDSRPSFDSPSMDVPSTPGMRTPMNPSRGSRLRSKVGTRQNLGSLFARSEDDDVCGDGGESSSCVTTTSVSGNTTLRKTLSFASEVS
ncbi:hypothetical protein KC19_11G125200 [Ceratodon purpureus]|uniref:CDT1 Geminin-binding domain-containing protein n=1 Tax=Ceratodon purpureus TaxID=3225 RepID=A0A8T0GJU8_CERPU|nr:hypothetical protein KC19_11G125200 [Ceratodon purpureus]KAG0557382.1 hypothetical protein KC19_11G125200 [Ceratodon purpureus]